MDTNLEIAGYEIVSKEGLLKGDLYTKLKLLYLSDKKQFNSKLSRFGLVCENLADVKELVTLIKSGSVKGFNFGQFAKSIKLNLKNVSRQKFKIL